MAGVLGVKLTEINWLLTEQTPQINRLTDRSNFSRIPNPICNTFYAQNWQGEGKEREVRTTFFCWGRLLAITQEGEEQERLWAQSRWQYVRPGKKMKGKGKGRCMTKSSLLLPRNNISIFQRIN